MLNRPINSSLPRQQVSWKVKFEEDVDKNGVSKWAKDSMDALEGVGRYVFYNNLELKKNYDIMQGRFNVEDYIDNFEAYDISTIIYQEMKLPSFLKHYDITTKAVKLLLGEFIKRPDIHQVVAQDVESTNEKLRLKTELVQNYIQSSIKEEITKKLLAQGIDPNKSEFKSEEESNQYKEEIQKKYQEMTPASIERYMRYDYRGAAESWGQAILKNDIQRLNLKEQDQLEFYHMLVSDRCFTHFFLTPEGYSTELWNPLSTFFQYSPDLRNVEEGNYVGRIMYISKSQVIDNFGWRMTVEQQESLYPDYIKGQKDGNVYSEFFNATLYPFQDYRQYDTLTEAVGQGVGYNPMDGLPYGQPVWGNNANVDGSNYLYTQSDLVQMTQVYWKAQRKIGKLVVQNPETGEISVELVDEFFKPKDFGVKEVVETFRDTNEPNTICWTWTTQVWQGIKINVNYGKDQTPEERNAIYIDVRPCEFQFKGSDPKLAFKNKLPVIGQIFNNINGRSQSVVDLIKPYQILVNAFYNQAYQVAQKNNGKFFLMGASLLPSVKDWGGEESQEKFMTMASNIGLGIIDDTPGSAQERSMQYGLKVMDMDESDRIQRLINLAMLIEQQGFMQLGITPQRQGQIQASETATGTSAAVNNSYAVTEIYFEQYSNYRRRKLQMMLDIAQYVASKGEEESISMSYLTSDLGQAFIQITKTELLLRDLNVFVNNTAEMQRKKDLIEQLILKNNQSQMPMSKLIELVRLDSLIDIQKKLEQQEAEAQQSAQAQQEAQQKHEQEMLQAQLAEKDKDRELKKYEIDTRAKTEIDKVTIAAIGAEGSYSQTEDLTDKVIAQRDITLKENQAASVNALAQQQLVHQQLSEYNKQKLEKEKMSADKALKEAEQKAKQAVENQKLEQIKTQNASQEKINQEANKAKLELADKQLEMKALELKMKQLEVANAKTKSNIELNHLEKKVDIEQDLADVKAESIKKLAKAKEEEIQLLSKSKVKEAEQSTSLKMKENEHNHDLTLKVNEEKAKQKIKDIKIKPRIKGK